jgi:hypothetical protein
MTTAQRRRLDRVARRRRLIAEAGYDPNDRRDVRRWRAERTRQFAAEFRARLLHRLV